MGNQLLANIAQRLRACLENCADADSGSNQFVAARLGGDEFAVLLENINGYSSARAIADQILQQLSAPYDLDGH